jgi:hypothetical protein
MRVTAEKRWFWKDDCPQDLAAWFESSGLAPGGGAVRIDEYLLDKNQKEIGVKKRGNKRGVELKGLVGVEAIDATAAFGGTVEIWCKWSSETLELKGCPTLKVEKLRRLRRFSVERSVVAEIGLDEDERPVARAQSKEGVDFEMSRLLVGNHRERWWTFGVEAFGSLASAAANFGKVVETLTLFPVHAVEDVEELSYPAWLTALSAR